MSAEAALVEQIRAGNEAAWNQLIAQFEGRLLAFVESRLRRRDVAEDVVQETLIGFLTSLPNYDPARSLESYLFSIAAHKLTDHFGARDGDRLFHFRPPIRPMATGICRAKIARPVSSCAAVSAANWKRWHWQPR